MSFSELTLPVDIPWKRMGVSKDMIDKKGGDLKFPQKWISSIAAFYHEPTEVPPDYCRRKITYVKIVATITSYQVTGKEVSILKELADSHKEFYALKNFNNDITRAFPCYGALLQVGVYPNPSAGVELHDYPYVATFQPQKREMYEVVSESGEMASQSATNINVLKGTMNTKSLENYDLELGGGGGGGHSGLFGLWSYQSDADPQKQVGTINRDQTQTQNVRTTDSSREKRESHAFSTSVSQMYSLLQGFHLGTNRTIFFLQPRPHIQDTKFSFIPGLRRLEGVQEFFLIINRPDSVPGFCVEVALETAHAYMQKAYQPRIIPLSDLFVPGNLNKTADALGLNLSNYNYYTRLVETWNSMFPWVRFLTHEAAKGNPGYTPKEIKKKLDEGALSNQQWSDLKEVTAHLPEIGTEDLALIFEEYESDSGDFFLTGRRLCSCVTPAPHEHEDGEVVDCEHSTPDNISECSPAPSIVFERPYRGVVNPIATMRRKDFVQTAFASNAQAVAMNDLLWTSLASNERKEYGKTSLLETSFALQGLAQVTRLMKTANARDRQLTEVQGLKKYVDMGLGSTSNVRTVLELGKLTTSEIARDLKLPEQEAKNIHFEIMKAGLKEVDTTTVPPNIIRVNPIEENFNFQFPPERLNKLEQSSKLVMKPTFGRTKSGGLRGLINRVLIFFGLKNAGRNYK